MSKRPRSDGSPIRDTLTRTWAIECMSFDGVDQSSEAPEPTHHVGGIDGLTVAAWVKRTHADTSNDRLIDFGNGAEKENIVINFGVNNMK